MIDSSEIILALQHLHRYIGINSIMTSDAIPTVVSLGMQYQQH